MFLCVSWMYCVVLCCVMMWCDVKWCVWYFLLVVMMMGVIIIKNFKNNKQQSTTNDTITMRQSIVFLFYYYYLPMYSSGILYRRTYSFIVHANISPLQIRVDNSESSYRTVHFINNVLSFLPQHISSLPYLHWTAINRKRQTKNRSRRQERGRKGVEIYVARYRSLYG